MKGLLLKEWYLGRKICGMHAAIEIVMIAAAVLSKNFFFIMFMSMLTGLIPVSLIAYDDQSKWTSYSNILPYTRAQIVSAKYIVLLIIMAAATIIIGVTGYIFMEMNSIDAETFLMMFVIPPAMGIITPGVMLPLVFKLGMEKGRIAYYVVLMVISALSGGISGFFGNAEINVNSLGLTVGILFVSIAMLMLSWILSVKFYEAREL